MFYDYAPFIYLATGLFLALLAARTDGTLREMRDGLGDLVSLGFIISGVCILWPLFLTFYLLGRFAAAGKS